MTQIYKLFVRASIVFCLFVIIHQSVPAVAANEAVYTIEDIKVDVSADNAAKAREKAFAQAQFAAFRRLAKRLLSDTQMEQYEAPELSFISSMVQDFEVTQEQISTVRYVGTYKFRFKNDAVRNYFGAQDLTYTDVGSKPVLVLPFYETGSGTTLWGGVNPWMQAWSKSRTYQGLVPVMVPIGDLQDVSDIEDNQAQDYNPNTLNDMVKRYKAREAVILVASADNNENPGTLDVMIYSTGGQNPKFVKKLITTKAEGESNEALFKKAVRNVRQFLQQEWKNKTIVEPSHGGSSLKARVRFSSLHEWIDTQRALDRVQGVTEKKVLSLTPREASVELVYQGTEKRLRLALSQADMTLTKPQINFENNGGYNYGSAPLVYDLYLDKYGRP